MARGDRGLDLVWPAPSHPSGAFDERDPVGDRAAIPAGAILIGEQHEPPVGGEARSGPSQLQGHEGEEPERFGLVGHELGDEPREPSRVLGKVAALRRSAGDVPLVEHEVEHREDLREAVG